MKNKNLHRIGAILIIGGIMLMFDGIGSILVEQNYHGLWFDLERVFRTVGGLLLSVLGVYLVLSK
jgi:hypothetical protein